MTPLVGAEPSHNLQIPDYNFARLAIAKITRNERSGIISRPEAAYLKAKLRSAMSIFARTQPPHGDDE